jgi:hypothetical protein
VSSGSHSQIQRPRRVRVAVDVVSITGVTISTPGASAHHGR